MVSALRLDLSQYDLLRSAGQSPPVMSCLNLAIMLNVDPSDLMYGRLDYKALAEHYRGNALYIPERYFNTAFSKLRSSLHVLSYIERTRGEYERNRMLRKFQISSEVFNDPTTQISFRFLSDLCAFLEQSGYADEDFARMGRLSAVVNKTGPVGSVLAQRKPPRAIYEDGLSLAMSCFDEDHDYRVVQATQNSVTVRAELKPGIREALGPDGIGNLSTCLVRREVLASFTSYSGLGFAKAAETQCIHRGHSHCEYEFDFSHISTLP